MAGAGDVPRRPGARVTLAGLALALAVHGATLGEGRSVYETRGVIAL